MSKNANAILTSARLNCYFSDILCQVLTRKTIYRNTNLYKSTTEQNPLPINRISLVHLLPQLTLTNQQN